MAHKLRMVAVAAIASIGFLFGLLVLSSLPSASTPAAAKGCSAREWLTPHGELTLRQDQNWLAVSGVFNDSKFVIADATNYQLFGDSDWRPMSTVDGRTRFGVPTRWALTHPGWAGHAWYILYNC